MIVSTISPTGGWFGTILFVLLVGVASVLFSLRTGKRIALLTKARPEDRTDHIDDRIGEFFLIVPGQRSVLRDPLPGLAHFFVFWGFIITGLGGFNLAMAAFYLSLPVIGDNHAFAIIQDTLILLSVLALPFFAFRRAVIRPKQLSSPWDRPWEAFIFLGLLFAMVFTLALIEAFAYAANNGVPWTPIGLWLGPWFSNFGMAWNIFFYRVFWWLHYISVFWFFVYLAGSRHLHVLATPFNVFFRSFQPKGALPLLENIEEREDYGVSKVEQFTWKQLLDGYACTECGRCNTVCPASNTGKPLFPKEIILGVKEELFAHEDDILGKDSLWSKAGMMGGYSHKQEAHQQPLIGGIISTDALWACTTCRACMEICPVSIEHVPKIIDMRRSLVLEESDFPSEVTSLFNNIERNGNPWEMSNDRRAEWAAGLNVPLLSENADAEVLYWVGCMGSFDQRNKKVATAIVTILQSAGVNFAILGPEERCTGDPARRIGNEYLWQVVAQQNIETLDSYGFNNGEARWKGNGKHNGQVSSGKGGATDAIQHRTIITACPHCFNTIKNEYPQLGGDYEVVHHTVFIDRLLTDGKIRLPEGFDQRKLTYHDPCYIGRYNDIYDEPRRVLSVLSRSGVTEMQRNRNKSFCCGGGGGRAWMEERIGKRINQTRVNQALETGAEVVAAACPFCITMFDDGIKGVEAEGRMLVEDIAEIVARAIETK